MRFIYEIFSSTRFTEMHIVLVRKMRTIPTCTYFLKIVRHLLHKC